MTLDEMIVRLSKNEYVDAVAIIGSAGGGELNPASDYDLLIVLDPMPLPLSGVVTYLGR